LLTVSLPETTERNGRALVDKIRIKEQPQRLIETASGKFDDGLLPAFVGQAPQPSMMSSYLCSRFNVLENGRHRIRVPLKPPAPRSLPCPLSTRLDTGTNRELPCCTPPLEYAPPIEGCRCPEGQGKESTILPLGPHNQGSPRRFRHAVTNPSSGRTTINFAASVGCCFASARLGWPGRRRLL